MAVEAGSTLGRYRIERRLGAGAMGEVYLALDPHIDRQLALKTVRIGDADAAEVEERKVRLIREARAAGRLVHPHVVTLFDAGEAGGIFYLAFEYVAGPDLAGRQRLAPPLTLGEVLRIGRQAADGLDAAHRQGIVHRDIKPSNIMLDRGGQVKISDFGIAKMLGQNTELTQTGSVVGSPHYLSPEQIRGEELDGRSDVFSLGVVLYELLTRHRPFEGDTITTLVYQILAREPNAISSLRPGLPERVERTVVRMLQKDRDARFATAREVADELSACEREVPPELLAGPAAPFVDELGETARLPSPPTPPPTPKPTPPAAWSMPMPSAGPPPPPGAASLTGSAPSELTGPTRLSPRVEAPPAGAVAAAGSGSHSIGVGPPPLPPPPGRPSAPRQLTRRRRPRSRLRSGVVSRGRSSRSCWCSDCSPSVAASECSSGCEAASARTLPRRRRQSPSSQRTRCPRRCLGTVQPTNGVDAAEHRRATSPSRRARPLPSKPLHPCRRPPSPSRHRCRRSRRRPLRRSRGPRPRRRRASRLPRPDPRRRPPPSTRRRPRRPTNPTKTPNRQRRPSTTTAR